MTIYIGSARIDENGNATGGAAGDQLQTSSTNDLKGEVSMQTMYTHSKGWYIFRAKSATHATKLAVAMKTACNNANIGYDQNQRNGIWTYGTATTTKTECDCSSLVRQCMIEAGMTDPGNIRTATMPTKLAATGEFYGKISYTSQTKTPVYNGDILVTKSSGHTVIVVSGSSRPSTLSSDGTASTSTSTSSSSSTSTSTKYTATLAVDGYWGCKTTKRLQTVLGTTVDGIVSAQNKALKAKNPGLESESWEWVAASKATGSDVVKAMQKKLGVTQDGSFGPKTCKALQKRYGTTQDGYCSSPSNVVKALQKKLNSGTF